LLKDQCASWTAAVSSLWSAFGCKTTNPRAILGHLAQLDGATRFQRSGCRPSTQSAARARGGRFTTPGKLRRRGAVGIGYVIRCGIISIVRIMLCASASQSAQVYTRCNPRTGMALRPDARAHRRSPTQPWRHVACRSRCRLGSSCGRATPRRRAKKVKVSQTVWSWCRRISWGT